MASTGRSHPAKHITLILLGVIIDDILGRYLSGVRRGKVRTYGTGPPLAEYSVRRLSIPSCLAPNSMPRSTCRSTCTSTACSALTLTLEPRTERTGVHTYYVQVSVLGQKVWGSGGWSMSVWTSFHFGRMDIIIRIPGSNPAQTLLTFKQELGFDINVKLHPVSAPVTALPNSEIYM